MTQKLDEAVQSMKYLRARLYNSIANKAPAAEDLPNGHKCKSIRCNICGKRI